MSADEGNTRDPDWTNVKGEAIGGVIAGLFLGLGGLALNWIMKGSNIGLIAGFFLLAILLMIAGWTVSKRFRSILERLGETFIRLLSWLWKQRRYIFLVLFAALLIILELVLYGLGGLEFVVFSFAHLVLVMPLVLLLFATGRPTMVSPGFQDAWIDGSLIQKIDFDYLLGESPIENGWKLAEGTQPAFEHPTDGFFGKVVAIQEVAKSGRPYALDYDVEPDTRRLGKFVEFVTKLEPGAAIYAHVAIAQSKARSTSTEGWIQVRIGTSQPQRVAHNEWVMCIMPTRLGNWQSFRIDLIDVVNQTFGNDGWSFEQLIGFRLRGNLELAYISVFKSERG